MKEVPKACERLCDGGFAAWLLTRLQGADADQRSLERLTALLFQLSCAECAQASLDHARVSSVLQLTALRAGSRASEATRTMALITVANLSTGNGSEEDQVCQDLLSEGRASERTIRQLKAVLEQLTGARESGGALPLDALCQALYALSRSEAKLRELLDQGLLTPLAAVLADVCAGAGKGSAVEQKAVGWLLRALHNVTEQAALCDQVKATEGLPGSLKVRAACSLSAPWAGHDAGYYHDGRCSCACSSAVAM